MIIRYRNRRQETSIKKIMVKADCLLIKIKRKREIKLITFEGSRYRVLFIIFIGVGHGKRLIDLDDVTLCISDPEPSRSM